MTKKRLLLLAQATNPVVFDLDLILDAAKLLAYPAQRLQEAQEPRPRGGIRPIRGDGDDRWFAVMSDGGDHDDPRQRQRCPPKNSGPRAHETYLLAKYL